MLCCGCVSRCVLRLDQIKLNIIVHDFAGHPFPAQLSRSLAARGHQVVHAYCSGVTSGKGELTNRPGDADSLTFVDVSSEPFERYSPIGRIRSELRYGRKLSGLMRQRRPNVILSANTPLAAQAWAWTVARRSNTKRVYWLQDFLGRGTRQVLTAKLPVVGPVVGRAFEGLETKLLRRSDAIIAITDDFRPLLASRGVESTVQVIQNWAPLDEVDVRPKVNGWSSRHSLAERPIALYSGTLGLKHDPMHLVAAAERLRGTDGAVVVVTEGLGRDLLERIVRERRLENLLLFDFVDYATLPDLLGSADVCLVILQRDAGSFSVPSKILAYLAAGRAIVAAVPAENLSARIIQNSGSGIVVDPGDYNGFGAAISELLNDQQHRRVLAAGARTYAEAAFDIHSITDAVLDSFGSTT